MATCRPSGSRNALNRSWPTGYAALMRFLICKYGSPRDRSRKSLVAALRSIGLWGEGRSLARERGLKPPSTASGGSVVAARLQSLGITPTCMQQYNVKGIGRTVRSYVPGPQLSYHSIDLAPRKSWLPKRTFVASRCLCQAPKRKWVASPLPFQARASVRVTRGFGSNAPSQKRRACRTQRSSHCACPVSNRKI